MIRNWKLLTIAAAILILTQTAVPGRSQTTLVSGSFPISFQSANGNSEYTVIYKYPSEVTIGQNLTISVEVQINQMDGLKLYLISYGLIATVHLDDGRILTCQLQVPLDRYLYQGAHIGPLNLVIPINASNNSVGISQSTSGQLELRFVGDVYYSNPIGTDLAESSSEDVGSVAFSEQSQNNQYVPYAATVVVAVVAVLLAYATFRTRRTGEKAPRSLGNTNFRALPRPEARAWGGVDPLPLMG